MLQIEENEVRSFLNKNRSKIEIKRINGIGEIVSSISLGITLLCADFKNILIPLRIFKITAWIITVAVFIWGLIELLYGLFSKHYTVDNLYNEFVELDKDSKHEFNIVLLKHNDSDGKYLLFNSTRWKCKLFPNYHALSGEYDKEKEQLHIKECIAIDIGIPKDDIKATYVGSLDDKKYSYGDNVNKKYRFHFYEVSTKLSPKQQKISFKHNGKKFCWMTLNKMYKKRNIVRKNKYVLDYVRTKFNIA